MQRCGADRGTRSHESSLFRAGLQNFPPVADAGSLVPLRRKDPILTDHRRIPPNFLGQLRRHGDVAHFAGVHCESGFGFEDYESGERAELSAEWPEFAAEIGALTRVAS